MKIKKKKTNVQASDELMVQPLAVPCPPELCESTCKYQAAIDLISAAVESLAEIAKDDALAKDSIANLGVVMLDLKGGC